MDLPFSPEDEAFRREAAAWLDAHLGGEFAVVRGRGGPGDEHALFDERLAWERKMAAAGWNCLGWPREHGGRGATLSEQVIFHEEYARAGGPGRLGHIGETLLGPTVIAFGSAEQKRRFLGPIVRAEELWCQGYSEPNAGSDLANVQTKAVLDGDDWVITGQKVWTSGAQWSDWCFALCRTEADAPSHQALSYLLVPMKQPGVEVRPIVQMTGTSEFSEVFFEGARTGAANIVGGRGEGWKVAMGTLAFERGASTLGQQHSFENELKQIFAIARENGAANDPVMRQRLADAWIGLRIMRYNALRMLTNADRAELGGEALITKLYWATWHRSLGKLAMDVLGARAEIAEGLPYELTGLQRMFLFTRSDTIYAGTNQIQRNIIAERALGLPREPKLAPK
ncbi:MAG TPA: acyl-CoA dehydrogenase family protein [Candidatus Binatia bacterium]|nr:acyl-CoA dehydrogenase family protein [Candidatus Binatia bacterium]